jgi:hypothetical protein
LHGGAEDTLNSEGPAAQGVGPTVPHDTVSARHKRVYRRLMARSHTVAGELISSRIIASYPASKLRDMLASAERAEALFAAGGQNL